VQVKVSRVTPEFIETDDDSRWTPDGRWDTDLACPLVLRPWGQHHTEACWAAELVRCARNLMELLGEKPLAILTSRQHIREAVELVEEMSVVSRRFGVAPKDDSG
jgi:hypothetical protein